MILLSITILVLTGSRPLNAIDFVFCTDTVKPYSVIYITIKYILLVYRTKLCISQDPLCGMGEKWFMIYGL